MEFEKRWQAYRLAFRQWSLAAGGVEGPEKPEADEARRAYRESRDRLVECLSNPGKAPAADTGSAMCRSLS